MSQKLSTASRRLDLEDKPGAGKLNFAVQTFDIINYFCDSKYDLICH